MTPSPETKLSVPSKLTLGGLLHLAPFFVPAGSEEDPLLLGWRLPKARSQRFFSAPSLELTSAEAIVAFGMIRVALDASLKISARKTSTSSSAWAKILSEVRSEPGVWRSLPNGAFATDLWSTNVPTRSDARQRAQVFGEVLARAPEELLGELRPHLPMLQRITFEALLNVYEHAYAVDEVKPVWLAATVLPLQAQRLLMTMDDANVRQVSGHDPREIGWLEASEGHRILELAICDAGLGIPRTLAPTSKARRRDIADQMERLSAGTLEFARLRANLHADLCDYAFRHYSTRKKDEEFVPRFLKFHWRGLYRCYRQIVDSGGGILVTSGLARVGYTARGPHAVSFKHLLGTGGDFPGTLWVIRLPLPSAPRKLTVRKPAAGLEPSIRWDRIVSWSQSPQEAARPFFEKELDGTHTMKLTAVVLPFVEVVAGIPELEDDQFGAGQLLDFLENGIDDKSLPVFCLGKSPENWRHHLRAVEADAEIQISPEGPPRLVGWMGYDGKVEWGVAGVVAENNIEFFRQLEQEGVAFPDSQDQRELAAELAAHHPGYLVWHEARGRLTLNLHGGKVAPDDYNRVLRAAWIRYWAQPSVQNEVITSRKGHVIVLATGTRVLRHFSVFRLLHQSRLLTEAMGYAFVEKVRTSLVTSGRATVVVDQPASRYICHALFVETGFMPDVLSLEDLVHMNPLPAKVIVFADAIFKGDTVKRVLRLLSEMRIAFDCVVTCVDLRDQGRGTEIRRGVGVFSLVELEDFEPESVSELNNLREIQTDAITNVPIEHERSPFVSLATQEDAETFLTRHPNHFAIGYHRLQGRTHTVTLPFARFAESQSSAEVAVGWTVNEIQRGLETLRVSWAGRQVTVFTRFDTKIGSLEDALSRKLDTALAGHAGIFLVRLPAAYHGTHTIFPQPGFNLFADCKEKTAAQLPLGGKRLPTNGYLAVYLDDATVTGNSLRDFLHHAMQPTLPTPAAILALAMINRLSPGEIRFLRLVHRLTVNAEGETRNVPFEYRYIFNLQIGSQRHPFVAGHELLEAIFEKRIFHPPVLRRYVEALHNRFRTAVTRQPWLHVFAPELEDHEITTEAVHLRHLLSLNQQNEPVVLEIMERLQQLTDTETADASVLTLFALEPAFLSSAPLRQFGREMIVSLAISVLNENQSIARKSDALAVLAAFPSAFIEHYREFAPIVLREDTLHLQLAAHLMAHTNTGHASTPPVIENLEKLAAERQSWLHRNLQVRRTIEAVSDRIRTREQAREIIFQLGSHFLRHSETDNSEWQVVWESLNNLARRWPFLGNPERRKSDLEGCHRQAVFAKRVVLPSFPALIYFLEDRGATKEVEALHTAHAVAQEYLTLYEDLLPRNLADFDLPRARLMADALANLQRATWITRNPSNRLLSGDRPEPKAGPLARYLPQVFSAPSGILARVGESILGSKVPFDKIREFAPGKHLMTIAPVPTRVMEQIFRMLLQNVKEHGDIESLHVELLPVAGARSENFWRVRLTNRVTDKGQPDEGQGIRLAKEAGEPYGVKIHHNYQRGETEWVAVLTIPSVFSLDQQIPSIEV